MSRPPRKRRADELTIVSEPPLSPVQFDAWREGIDLFDRGEHWHAHERWEDVWRAMGDAPAHDAEIVIRGFIQLAAALHLVTVGRLDGARSNFAKAAAKLALAPSTFLGIDVERLRGAIASSRGVPAERVAIRLRPDGAST